LCHFYGLVLWLLHSYGLFLHHFKDFNSVTGGATYIPWLQFEPTLDGWKVLFKPGSQGGINIVGPYFNSIFVTVTASFISIVLGT
jgi:multiple sugar transport system permease protein